jgi:NAD(P)-dependent dehydrogenase (short-subunit alcohol dehydrogenase family)
MDVTGAVAVVTGGASGIGAACARRIALLGAKVLIADLDEDQGKRLADEIGGTFARVDVACTDDIVDAAEIASEMGPVRILVNSAGIGGAGQRTVGRDAAYGSAADIEEFRRVIAINLVGSYDCSRLIGSAIGRAEPLDGGERGVIVNIASVAAFDGQVGHAAYTASKAGVVGMTLSVARDLAVFGVRVNSIAPGPIDTPILGSSGEANGFMRDMEREVLFPPRLGRAEEVASMVVECITNSFMNGETIRVDGGIRLTRWPRQDRP